MKDEVYVSLKDICTAYRNCTHDLSRLQIDLRILRDKMENCHACRYDRVLLEPKQEDQMVNWVDKCIRKEQEIDRCLKKKRSLQEKICSLSSPADLPVVWLVLVEGKTIREAARIAGISSDSVRRKLNKKQIQSNSENLFR